jgi:TolB-like protein
MSSSESARGTTIAPPRGVARISPAIVCLAVVFLLHVPAPAVARAAEPAASLAPGASARQRVAVVRVDFEGNVAEAARDLFLVRVVEGLAAAQFEVFSGAAVAQKLLTTGRLGSCRDGACYPAVAQALGVTYLVAGRVVESSKNYELSLELINGRTGGVIGTNRERCEICGVDEAGEKMALAASALRARLEAVTRTPARFIIQSRPAGAALAIDGVPVGRTPIDRELVGGLHKVELSAPGYDPLTRTVTAVSGVDETLDLELVRLPMKFPFRQAGWAAVAVGAAALVAGIWALSADGDEIACASTARDDRGHCPEVRSTRALGAALIGLGGATATLGGAWLYIAGGTPWVALPQENGAPGPLDRTTARGARLIVGGHF